MRCPASPAAGAASASQNLIEFVGIQTSPRPTDMLTMTDTAVSQLRNLLAKEQGGDKALRVYVTPGGCSGFSYGMSLDDDRAEDDQTFTIEGVQVVVDPFSLQYLDGAQIDYVNALM